MAFEYNLKKLIHDIFRLKFNDKTIKIPTTIALKIPVFEAVIKGDSFLFKETKLNEYDLREYVSDNFENLYYYLRENTLSPHILTPDAETLCNYLCCFSFVEKSRQYECLINDFIEHKDELIFYSLEEFKNKYDLLFLNEDIVECERENVETDIYGYIHILTKYSSLLNIDISLVLDKININLRTFNKKTALMLCCITSNIYSSNKTVKLLLSDPRINVNLQEKNDSMTALMYATMYSTTLSSSVETVKILLEDPRINVNIKDAYGRTALMIACEYSAHIKLTGKYEKPKTLKKDVNDDLTLNIETLKLLLNDIRVDVNVQNIYGETALIIATLHDRYKKPKDYKLQKIGGGGIMALVAFGMQDIYFEPNYNNRSYEPEFFEIIRGSTSIMVKELLTHYNINVNIKDNNGKTALMCAAAYSEDIESIDTVSLLLEHPKINISIKDINNNNFLHLCKKYNNKEKLDSIIRLLAYKRFNVE